MTPESVSNWCIHSLKCYFSATKWDRNTICVVLYSLIFLKPVHVQNILLPQYTPNNDAEQSNNAVWIVANGISLMICSIWSLSSFSVCGLVAYNVSFKVPQSWKSTGVKSGDRGENSAALPRHPIHLWLIVRSTKFIKLTWKWGGARLVGIKPHFHSQRNH